MNLPTLPLARFVLALLVVGAGCDRADESTTRVYQSAPYVEPDAGAAVRPPRAVVTVSVMPGFVLNPEPYGTIFEAYEDGRVLWSQDNVRGGGKLVERKLLPQDVAALRERLSDLARKDGRHTATYAAVDCSVTEIRFSRSDGIEVAYASDHELAEVTGESVATASGPQQGTDADDAAGHRPPGYAAFLTTWRQMRQTIAKVIDDARTREE